MESIAELIRDLLAFITVMFALLIALIVVVAKLSDNNPLKCILSLLSYGVGVTFGAGVVAIPVEPLSGLDAVYDIVVPLALAR